MNNNLKIKHMDGNLYSYVTKHGKIISMSQEDMKEISLMYNNLELKEYIREKHPEISEKHALNIAEKINIELNETLANSEAYIKLENAYIEKFIKDGE